MKKSTFCLFLLPLLVAINAYANEDWHYKKGDIELSVTGSFSCLNFKQKEYDVCTTVIDGSLGYLITNKIEVSVKGSGIWTDVDETDSWAGGLGADIKYNYPLKGFTPYFGAQYLLLWGELNSSGYDTDIDGSLYGPLVGLKYFVTESTIFTIEYQYQFFSGDDIEAYLKDSRVISIGVSFRF